MKFKSQDYGQVEYLNFLKLSPYYIREGHSSCRISTLHSCFPFSAQLAIGRNQIPRSEKHLLEEQNCGGE
jgi:hypothetical protein